MSIFTKQDMWNAAVKQMGLTQTGYMALVDAIVLETPEDVAELYKTLQEAHWEAIADYERTL